MSTHERISRHEEVKGSSNRAFGLTFAGVFAVLAVLQLWRGHSIGYAWLAAAAVFAAVAYLAPAILTPLNKLWLKFGLLLHRIVSPLVMGMMFYLVITPVGMMMRMAGKDLLRLRRDPKATSYWIMREPPGPAPDSMKNQF